MQTPIPLERLSSELNDRTLRTSFERLMYVQFMSFVQGDNSQGFNTILKVKAWQSDVKKSDQIVLVMFGFGVKVFSVSL